MSHASHWREECEKAHARIDELKRENAALRADAADWKARFEGKVASHSAGGDSEQVRNLRANIAAARAVGKQRLVLSHTLEEAEQLANWMERECHRALPSEPCAHEWYQPRQAWGDWCSKCGKARREVESNREGGV